ncbi:hypothetical protein [uncultured Thiohalocapsa sp.]|uniref:hypothetical protein n=1 Tax=uncultured Thiohalocapsa sp. TaxID=768990 RepID=UPI0025EE05B2|nr:hypothetical protein [uncultured Thiohalocapsa sp.]
MTYMVLWLGGLTGSAFLYGVGWGLCLYPPVTWALPPRRRADNAGTTAERIARA